MSNMIKSRIVKIGRSRGIRIPKPILAQLGWGEEVEMSVRGDQLVIRPIRRPRSGWEEQFARLVKRLGQIGAKPQQATLSILTKMFAE